MNKNSFIQAINRIHTSAMSGLIKAIEVPPGRKPSPKLANISQFYNCLKKEDKQIFKDALDLAARQAINNLLLIIDGDLAIESNAEKGLLELYYANDKDHILLNDPAGVSLSELFRSE